MQHYWNIENNLSKNKKDKIKSLNFGIYNDFELSQKYDRILNQVYKTYKQLEKFHNITKKDLYIHLYNTLENEYKRFNLSAYDILNDYTLKENICQLLNQKITVKFLIFAKTTWNIAYNVVLCFQILQSKYTCVKCLGDGELPLKRKLCCGTYVASRCCHIDLITRCKICTFLF